MSTDVIALNGEVLQMSNVLITPSMNIKDADQSGQASSTASSEQGIKAKELKVSGYVPYSDKTHLARLFELAEALGTDGRQARYRVACEEAQAIRFRQATFTGNVDATPQTNLRAWLVSFTLREHLSVAERKAMQGDSTAAVAQTATGGTVLAEESAEQQTWFERQLQKVNDTIGPA